MFPVAVRHSILRALGLPRLVFLKFLYRGEGAPEIQALVPIPATPEMVAVVLVVVVPCLLVGNHVFALEMYTRAGIIILQTHLLAGRAAEAGLMARLAPQAILGPLEILGPQAPHLGITLQAVQVVRVLEPQGMLVQAEVREVLEPLVKT